MQRPNLQQPRVITPDPVPDQQQPHFTPVLARPYPQISGPRHIPVLVNANQFPFLRIKKPQSPLIGALIRHSIRSREKSLAWSSQLEQNISLGEDEDVWDEILRADFGLLEEGVSWTDESHTAHREIKTKHIADAQKKRRIARQMTIIVEKEKALAQEERAELRKNTE